YKPDPEAQSRRSDKALASSTGRKRILHISNFRPVKRVLDCIQVLGRVREQVDAELFLAGDGPERGPAERLAHELNVDKYVRFLGKQDHMERLIPRMHALHLPSEMEAFGLAALEAMACGVPPVATRTGGVPDLIDHGVNGFMEPVGDTDAQAKTLINLLTDNALFGQVSAAARHTAESRFCSDLIIPKYERYYADVCNQAGS
ncbi:MAG TPA: glycosyltransferase, partial [Bryobacteraceae bacterium]